MARATYKYEVDWNNNGLWTDAGDDISQYVVDAEWVLGRDYASQLLGRTVIGRARLTLNNLNGEFNSRNASSPFFGNILPNRPFRISQTFNAATVVMFQGFLDGIRPEPIKGGGHLAILEAFGPIGKYSEREVSVAKRTNVLTGTAIGFVLDEVGVPAGGRLVDAGQTTMSHWWTGGKVKVLFALRDIEETEAGFLRETKDGKIAYEDRHHRLKAPHTVSQATYSDATGAALAYRDIEQGDERKQIFNIVRAAVRKFTVGAEATLWTLAEVPSIPNGETRTYWANYPNPLSVANGKVVEAWVTPASTTDFTGNSAADGSGTNLTANLSVAVTKFDNSMKIDVTNGGTVAAYLTLLKARGTPLLESDPVTIEKKDATSQGIYGERSYPIPAPFLPDTAVALDYVGWILSIYKDPIPVLPAVFFANRSDAIMTEIMNRDVSDRVTIVANNKTKLGINEDFFVEAIRHMVTKGGSEHIVMMEHSPASAYAGFWVLGTSLLGVSTRLAY